MYKAVGYNSLGETLLIYTLSNAYYALTNKSALRENEHLRESKNCITFIQNSGIHQIVTIFDLFLDSDKLHNLFFYYVKVA